jgi:hypothetical protein
MNEVFYTTENQRAVRAVLRGASGFSHLLRGLVLGHGVDLSLQRENVKWFRERTYVHWQPSQKHQVLLAERGCRLTDNRHRNTRRCLQKKRQGDGANAPHTTSAPTLRAPTEEEAVGGTVG